MFCYSANNHYLCICKLDMTNGEQENKLSELMSQKIEHRGVVDCIDDRVVRVRIMQSSACASCRVAAHCNLSEQKLKVVDVPIANVRWRPAIGDEVTVAASSRMGSLAVVLAFVLPFLVMVGVVFAVGRFTDSEPVMALSGLASLIPYYIILYACRKKIGESIAFELINHS